jgi:hypothetical protein
MANPLNNPAVPSLPVAPETYQRSWGAGTLNVLRLYFNQIKAMLDEIVRLATIFNSGDYGYTIKFPHGAFSSQTIQTVVAPATPTRVTFDTEDYKYLTHYTAGNGITFEKAGRYNIQFSCQLTNNDANEQDFDIWLRKNGSTAAYDIPDTASVVTLPKPHGGNPGYHIIAANFFVEVVAGDFIEFWWAASDTQVQIEYLPAITVPFDSPGAPSIVATVSFVSAVP